jgi:hypothetical protein
LFVPCAIIEIWTETRKVKENSIKRIPRKIRPLSFASQKLVAGKINFLKVDESLAP